MKYIQLSRGMQALVDDETYNALSQFKWYAHKQGPNLYYAARNIRRDGKRATLLMHRDIMAAQDGQILDHANKNTLDNRKQNLRFCSRAQNRANGVGYAKHGYKGVHRNGKYWEARIIVDQKYHFLGNYPTKREAHRAYLEAANIHYPGFAPNPMTSETRG